MTKYMLADTEVIYDRFTKKDKMCSVYVPFDCKRNCAFCISKGIYSNGVDKDSFMKTLSSLVDSDVSEIVITGGEPMSDIKTLVEMLEMLHDKNVFINTSLFEDGYEEFVDVVNKYDCVNGINISRHGSNIFVDSSEILPDKSLSLINLVDDSAISLINKPVRINIVVSEKTDKDFILSIVNRWGNLNKNNLDITFREMYQTIDETSLHTFNSPVLNILTDLFEYHSSLYCHACDKIFFTGGSFTGDENGGLIRYHKGLSSTRIKIGNIVEMQELVLYPNGKLCTDWDGSEDGIEEFKKILNIK